MARGKAPKKQSMKKPIRSNRGGGAEAPLLFLTGFLMAAAGVTVAMSPSLPESIREQVADVSRLGLDAGTLCVGGLLVLGLGIVLRTIGSIQLAPAPAPVVQPSLDSDVPLVLEQVVSDLAQLRTSMEQVQSGIAQLEASQAMTGGGREGSAQPLRDVIFGMATSLDKVGARLDQTIQERFDSIGGKIDGISAGGPSDALEGVLGELRAQVRSLAELASAAPTAAAPHEQASAPVQSPVAPAQPAAAPLPPPPQQQPEPGETAFSEPEEPSLGVLDQLGDPDHPAAPRRSPFEGVRTSGGRLTGMRGSVPSPEHHGSPEPQHGSSELDLGSTGYYSNPVRSGGDPGSQLASTGYRPAPQQGDQPHQQPPLASTGYHAEPGQQQPPLANTGYHAEPGQQQPPLANTGYHAEPSAPLPHQHPQPTAGTGFHAAPGREQEPPLASTGFHHEPSAPLPYQPQQPQREHLAGTGFHSDPNAPHAAQQDPEARDKDLDALLPDDRIGESVRRRNS